MKKSAREFLVSSADADLAIQTASELGIDLKTTKVKGAGGVELLKMAIDALNDPFVQGAFLGFLVSRGVVIETTKDGITITIKNLKSLKHLLLAWIGK
jgi:hypothetical protein